MAVYHGRVIKQSGKLLMQLFRMAVGVGTAFALDQISKIAVVHWLDLASTHVIPVVPPYLVFVMA